MPPIPRLLRALTSVLLAAPLTAGTVTLTPVLDATLYAENGTLANGAGQGLFVGRTATNSARRALIQFDVAGAVPAGAQVTSVQLVLNVDMTISGTHDCTMRRALVSWGEGTSVAPGNEGGGAPATANDATWSHRFFGTTQVWTTAGGDASATVSAVGAIGSFGVNTIASTPQLVADVQDMLDAPAGNFGWLLVGDESAPTTAKRFSSRQNSNPSARPQLVVEFQTSCTAQSYCVAAPNSDHLGGAVIGWQGSLSVAQNAFTLTVTDATHLSPLYFQLGDQPAQAPFGNGFQCLAGTVFRLNRTVMTDAAGFVARHVDFGAMAATVITPGSTWNFQAIYRDNEAGFALFNLSDGLAVTFCP